MIWWLLSNLNWSGRNQYLLSRSFKAPQVSNKDTVTTSCHQQSDLLTQATSQPCGSFDLISQGEDSPHSPHACLCGDLSAQSSAHAPHLVRAIRSCPLRCPGFYRNFRRRPGAHRKEKWMSPSEQLLCSHRKTTGPNTVQQQSGWVLLKYGNSLSLVAVTQNTDPERHITRFHIKKIPKWFLNMQVVARCLSNLSFLIAYKVEWVSIYCSCQDVKII